MEDVYEHLVDVDELSRLVQALVISGLLTLSKAYRTASASSS